MHYESIKNHHRLIVVDLNRQEELDADPNSIQQIAFVRQLKKLNANSNATNACADQIMLILTIFEKPKEKQLTFSQGNINYKEARVNPIWVDFLGVRFEVGQG